MYLSSFKEIVTKAIVGKAKKTSKDDFTLESEETPNTILGCWVINHTFSGTKNDKNGVNINGAFDINIWYSYDKNTKTAVTTKKFNYFDSMIVPLKEDINMDSSSEIIVRCLKQPTVSNVLIDDGKIKLSVEKELGVEIVGEAKVKISVEDEEDDYEDVYDSASDDEIEKEVDEEYIK